MSASIQILTACRWARESALSCFPGWICSLKCFPSPPLSPNGRLYCVWLRLHSKGKARLHTAGEAEAAEPNTHNGAPREGEGSRLQRDWEPGSRNGGSKGGTKERQEREDAGSHHCWGWRGEWRRTWRMLWCAFCGVKKMCVKLNESMTEGRRVVRGEEAKMDSTGNNNTGVEWTCRRACCVSSVALWCYRSQSI